MEVFLPIAQVFVNPIEILMLSALVGVLSGLFGVGGGFLMTPFLIFLGVPPAYAVANEANNILATSVSGSTTHYLKNTLDYKLGLMIVIGGAIGTTLGIYTFTYFKDIGKIDTVISLAYMYILAIIGTLMLVESLGEIDKAKKNQVPSHVIEKAIDKARGGGGEDYSPARYEGFGPGGCIAIIECLTDNPNRTICDVRQAFTKTNSKIGTQGTVSHMFDHLAIFSFEANDENEEEKVLDVLMEADINVVDIENEDNILTIFSPHTEYSKTKQALTHHQPDIDFKTDEIQYIPQNHMTIDEQDQEMFDKFLMMLDECDDVQNVYHNVKTI